MSAVQRNYDEATNRDQILESFGRNVGTGEELSEPTHTEALEGRQTLAAEEQLPGERATQGELTEARETVADEHQPNRDHLPGKETLTVGFRGHDFEFDEDPTIVEELKSFHEDADKSEAELRQWAIRKLDELCTDPAANESYWGQFAVSRNDGKDALVDVVLDVAGAPDEEERRKAEQFRNQR